MILTTQKLTKAPLSLRAAVSNVLVWKTANTKELKAIWEEYVNIPWQKFLKMLEFVWQEPHDFLMIRLDKGEDQRYHRNFDLIKMS